MAGPAEYAKHLPPHNCRTSADLRLASKRGKSVSYFKFGIGPEALQHTIRAVEQDYFDDLVGTLRYRGAVHCLTDVGFVKGEPSPFIAIEWTPALIHAYPIGAFEIDKFQPPTLNYFPPHVERTTFVYEDSLQGYAREQR